MKRPKDINDERLHMYLRGEMTADELRACLTGVEPYELASDGTVRVLTGKEYRAKITAVAPKATGKRSTDRALENAIYRLAAASIRRADNETLRTLLIQHDRQVESRPDWSECQKLARRNMLVRHWVAAGRPGIPTISVCINTQNEGPRLKKTIEAFRNDLQKTGIQHQIIVVADAVTDGCIRHLGADVTVLRTKERLGCGRCKAKAARHATGDVLLFADAHHTVEKGHLADLAVEALSGTRIACPLLVNIRYDKQWNTSRASLNIHIAQDSHVSLRRANQYRFWSASKARRVTGRCVAGVTCMSRETHDRLGGWNQYSGWHGSQELGMSLKALFAGVEIMHLTDVWIGHEFRKRFPYKAPSAAMQTRNRWHAWRVALGEQAFERLARPKLEDQKQATQGRAVLRDSRLLADAERFDKLRQVQLTAEIKSQLGLDEDSLVTAEEPELRISIAYLPGKRLGEAYNRIMRDAPPGSWVLLLDHDVSLVDAEWYKLCMAAVRRDCTAGMFTCWTNRIRCSLQLRQGAPAGDDLGAHRLFAKRLRAEHGDHLTDITNSGKLVSGFFMLTSRAAWERVGGFRDGFLGVDNDYHKRLKRAGLRVYRLDGLYCYHAKVTTGNPEAAARIEPSVESTKETAPITVGVVTHRRYMPWAIEAMRSVDRQSLPAAERYLCIDGPNGLAMPDYAAQHGWRLIRTNAGSPQKARNGVWSRARTPWVVLLDADDALHPDYFLAVAQAAEAGASSNLGIIYPDRLLCDRALRQRQLQRAPEWSEEKLRESNYIPVSAAVCCDMLRAVGGFAEDLPMYHDWELWLRAIRAGWIGTRVDGVPLRCRQHSWGRLSIRMASKRDSLRAQLLEAHAHA